MKSKLLAASLALGFAAAPSFASTIDFTGAPTQGGGSYTEDGLVFDDVRIIPSAGNCTSGSGPLCGALNRNEVSTLTSVISGGLFSLTSIWYDVQGANSVLTLMSNLGGVVNLGPTPTPGTFDLTTIAGFANVSWVQFTANGGNVRFDDIGQPGTAAVPLPATGALMLAGFGALALTRRKRAAA